MKDRWPVGQDDIQIEGYEIHAALARGSSATVFRATQRSLGRPVAIKVFRTPFVSDASATAFRAEIAALGRLSNHPNIVPVIEADVTPSGFGYIVLSLMSGSLVGLSDPAPESLGRHLRFGAKIAGALAAAHQAGFIHCDVKPGNVLISEFGEPALTDFGSVAYPGAAPATGSYQITLDYAAPELLLADDAVPESDVYSWASTVHYLLRGLPPRSRANGESVEAFADRIRNEPYHPPTVSPAVDELLGDLLRSSLEWRPQDRPTATEFAGAINDIAEAAGLQRTEVVGAVSLQPTNAVPLDTSSGPPTSVPTGSAGPATSAARPRASLLIVAAVVVLAALVVGVVAWSGRDDATGAVRIKAPKSLTSRSGGGSAKATTSTTTKESYVTPVVHLPPVPAEAAELMGQVQQVADRGAQFDARLSAVLGDTSSPMWSSLSYSDVFPPSGWFPNLEPLPARARWVFNTPDKASKGVCKEFIPAPLTMVAFAGRANLRAESLTGIATYTLRDVDEAKSFFVGKSMLMRSTRLDCTPGTPGQRPKVLRRDFNLDSHALDAANVRLDEWNAFVNTEQPRYVRPTESLGYELLARIGRQIYEIRIGVPASHAADPDQVASLASALLVAMQPAH